MRWIKTTCAACHKQQRRWRRYRECCECGHRYSWVSLWIKNLRVAGFPSWPHNIYSCPCCYHDF